MCLCTAGQVLQTRKYLRKWCPAAPARRFSMLPYMYVRETGAPFFRSVGKKIYSAIYLSRDPNSCIIRRIGQDLYLMGKLAPAYANHGGGAARAKLEQRHSPPARFHPRQVELSLFQSFSIFIFQENPLLTNRSIIILLSPTAVPGEICTSVGGKGGTGTPKGLNTRAKDSHPGRRFSRKTSSTHRRGNGQ